MSKKTLHLITGRCCTDWPLVYGQIPTRCCGLCGEIPVIVPGTERTVEYESSEGIKLVASERDNADQ